MKLTKKEAKDLHKLLVEGFPFQQTKRDRLAKIWFRLEKYLKLKK